MMAKARSLRRNVFLCILSEKLYITSAQNSIKSPNSKRLHSATQTYNPHAVQLVCRILFAPGSLEPFLVAGLEQDCDDCLLIWSFYVEGISFSIVVHGVHLSESPRTQKQAELLSIGSKLKRFAIQKFGATNAARLSFVVF